MIAEEVPAAQSPVEQKVAPAEMPKTQPQPAAQPTNSAPVTQ